MRERQRIRPGEETICPRCGGWGLVARPAAESANPASHAILLVVMAGAWALVFYLLLFCSWSGIWRMVTAALHG